MRLFLSVIASAAMIFAASAASAAVTYTASASAASGNPLNALVVGDVVTIDIQLTSDGEAVFGIGASATGYDRNVVSYTTGQVAPVVLAGFCFPGAGCFSGLDNLAQNPPVESLANPLGPEVQFLDAVSTSGSTNTGAADWAPGTETPGPQFSLVFTAVGPGSTSIVIDALAEYGDATVGTGGAFLTTTGDVVSLTVVPEPGTALLMGLGLAGLAAAGRRD